MFGAPTHRPQAPAGTPPRVLLATQRKAGTYLLSSVVARLGFHQTHYHLNKRRMQAYDPALLELGAQQPRLFDVQIRLVESLKLIRHGEFAASHLPPTARIRGLVGDFRVVSCVRELRSALRSEARFALSTRGKGEDLARAIERHGIAGFITRHGARHIKRAQEVAAWGTLDNGILLKFEELKSDPDLGVGRLATFLGVTDRDPAEVLEAAKAGQSLTKSEGFLPLDWDDRAEAAFAKIGGPAANTALGYST